MNSIRMNDWENPAINSINRLPARTFAPPLATGEAALTDALVPESPYVLSRGLSVAALFSAHAASGENDHPVP